MKKSDSKVASTHLWYPLILWQRSYFVLNLASHTWHHVLSPREACSTWPFPATKRRPAWGRFFSRAGKHRQPMMRAGYLQKNRMMMKLTKANRIMGGFSKKKKLHSPKEWNLMGFWCSLYNTLSDCSMATWRNFTWGAMLSACATPQSKNLQKGRVWR